jgi:hypothetical protein
MLKIVSDTGIDVDELYNVHLAVFECLSVGGGYITQLRVNIKLPTIYSSSTPAHASPIIRNLKPALYCRQC